MDNITHFLLVCGGVIFVILLAREITCWYFKTTSILERLISIDESLKIIASFMPTLNVLASAKPSGQATATTGTTTRLIKNVDIKKYPDEHTATVNELKQNTFVCVLDRHDDWLSIAMPSKSSKPIGWIHKSAVES